MENLVLIRHGQSLWNRENRFTGWTDVDLTDQGIEEARQGGISLRMEGFFFDFACTSVLKRAIRTLWIVLDEMDLLWIPAAKSWRLNERHYGALQGLNKSETATRYGEEQVLLWRRSYSVRPPLLDPSDERHPSHDPRYREVPLEELPSGECLADTVKRVVPFFEEVVRPRLASEKRVVIAAHGNSLRALVKYLEDLTEEEIMKLNIPTGIPLIYNLDSQLKPLGKRYLGDPETVAEAIKAVANQGKAAN